MAAKDEGSARSNHCGVHFPNSPRHDWSIRLHLALHYTANHCSSDCHGGHLHVRPGRQHGGQTLGHLFAVISVSSRSAVIARCAYNLLIERFFTERLVWSSYSLYTCAMCNARCPATSFPAKPGGSRVSISSPYCPYSNF